MKKVPTLHFTLILLIGLWVFLHPLSVFAQIADKSESPVRFGSVHVEGQIDPAFIASVDSAWVSFYYANSFYLYDGDGEACSAFFL